MKNRKTLFWLVVVLVVALTFALASCSKNGNQSNQSGSQSTNASDESSAGGSQSDKDDSAKNVTMNNVKYAKIGEALAAVPASSTDTYVITLEKGTYEESGLAYNGSATVKIVGNTTTKYGADVIVVGHGSNMTAEKTRSLLAIQGTGDIILENLTLKTDWSRARASAEGMASNTQAEVLGTDTKGNTVAYNCSFISNQDTLRTAGKAWFYDCYIEGDVDFIWMEQAGAVALYEKCNIVSVYDDNASSHYSYVAAPRMAKSTKVGKGLVIFNSTIKETEEAKTNGQQTYLARNPWSSSTDYYNQVAYINTTCTDIEADIWKGTPTATEFAKTIIGWKMDQATATSLNYSGNDDILDATTVANEFSGRKAILNRVYDTGKQKYEKDSANSWDIDALITANGWTVDEDTSSDVLDGENTVEPVTYAFDGSVDQSALCEGFAKETDKSHYVGKSGATITLPVSGKCYVEVYGYYAGTVEVKAGTQGEAVMFFNNNSTSSEVLNTYVVYDETATSFVLTAKATTYITKIVVTEDADISFVAVTGITVTESSSIESVGVANTLSASIAPTNATNKSVKWSSSAPEIGEIDEYTGRVTFKAEGEVTFTATACDGSNVTEAFTCHPVAPKWTVCEWYTTDNDVKTEGGDITGIENFNTNSSAYKGISTGSYSFTNVNGTTITTAKGLKLNSAGKLTISTTKSQATLTVIIAPNNQLTATPKVSNGTITLTPVSTETREDGTTVYVFDLATAGTWDIERGDTSSENNPILYAKCEYETRIVKSSFFNYKGGTYTAPAGDVYYNHNNETEGSMVLTTDEVTLDNLTYKGAKNNGTDNWLQFNTGATITFKVVGACTLNLYFYNGNNNVSVTVNGTAVTTATSTQSDHTVPYAYELTEGEVVITATGNGYIGALAISYPAPAATVLTASRITK